jgi:hypothetical protein
VTVTGTTTITPTTSAGGVGKTTSSASSSVSQLQPGSGAEKTIVSGLWSGLVAVLLGLL